jgi:hypothetical protein
MLTVVTAQGLHYSVILPGPSMAITNLATAGRVYLRVAKFIHEFPRRFYNAQDFDPRVSANMLRSNLITRCGRE